MKIIQKRKEKVLSFFDINNEFFIDRYFLKYPSRGYERIIWAFPRSLLRIAERNMIVRAMHNE